MNFETLIRRFRILFSFFCIIPFSTSKRNLQDRKIYAETLPAILYLGLSIGLFLFATCYRIQTISHEDIFATIVSNTRIFTEFLLQFIIIGQSLVFRERLKKLCRTYDLIENYMKTRMKHNVDFNLFQSRLYQLTITVFLPHLVAFILRRFLMKNISVFINIFAIFYLLSSLVQMYIIAHVELLKFFLTLMTRWLQNQVSDFSATYSYGRKDLWREQQLHCSNKIMQLKFIHFKLWESALNFNCIFGWSLAAVIVRNSIEIAYAAYWIYLNSHKGTRFIAIFRKLEFECSTTSRL